MDFKVELGTRFKVNPSVFPNAIIERVVLDPKPHARHDEIVTALFLTEPEQMLYHVCELSAGYIWNLGKVPNLSNEEILQNFETALRAAKISPSELKEAKQHIRNGMSRGHITIQKPESILTREY